MCLCVCLCVCVNYNSRQLTGRQPVKHILLSVYVLLNDAPDIPKMLTSLSLSLPLTALSLSRPKSHVFETGSISPL